MRAFRRGRRGGMHGCRRKAGRQLLDLVGFAPLGKQTAPLGEVHEGLFQLLLVHLYPGVEELHARLEGGAVKDHIGHLTGHGLAVQMLHHKAAHGLPGIFKGSRLAVEFLGQRQKMRVFFPDAGHGLVGNGQIQRVFAVHVVGVGLFGNEVETQPVLEHDGFKNADDGLLKLFLLFGHGDGSSLKVAYRLARRAAGGGLGIGGEKCTDAGGKRQHPAAAGKGDCPFLACRPFLGYTYGFRLRKFRGGGCASVRATLRQAVSAFFLSDIKLPVADSMIDFRQRLNAAQYEAVSCGDGPVLVVAGAGSGKTRTIVHRLAWLAEQGVPPASMLLLTFTRKAAHEMLQRAAEVGDPGLAGVQGGTFHSFAFGVLRRWRPEWLEGRGFSLMDSADIAAAVKECRESLGIGKGDRSFPKTQAVVGLLSKARNKEQGLDVILQREACQLLPHAEALTRLGEAYTAYRRERGLLDYDDLLFELETLLRRNDEAAAQLRARFRHILVDEYQDTNLVQARIVRLLAGPPEAAPEDMGNVMAVGDEAQSIYAFRGANVRNILDFPRLFPGARIIRLEENYRSTKPILDVANSVLSHAEESFRKHLFTRREGGAPVRLVTALSDRTQASLVAGRIGELLDRYRPGEIAVLFRAGFHSFQLEMALNQRGIAFRKYGGLRYAEAAHVKDAIAYARLLINPLDMPSFERVAALHPGIGPRTARKIHATLLSGDSAATRKALARHEGLRADLDFLDTLRARALSPAGILSSIAEQYRPHMEQVYPDDWPRRQQALEEIVQMAAGYEELDVFIADLALETPEDEDGDEGAVTLSTIHSSKGLEWDAVLIIDLAEDRFPSRHSMSRPEEFEEERRLMYVACTRARKELDLYCPATIFDKAERGSMPVGQSPFVRELSASLVEAWSEGYGGMLRRRRAGDSAAAGRTSYGEDCQLPPEERAALGRSAAPADRRRPAPAADAGACGYCRHRIFGRGKIVRRLPPDKVQVNFPGFGLKVILAEYLLPEE